MIIEQAREVLKIEAEGILGLVDRLGEDFKKGIEMILQARGRVILTGMGKSGLIARKISATLNSTGTPSLFLHPAEAIHGDLGMVTRDDIVLAVSNSGETSEINAILPILKKMGANIVSFTGGLNSPMALMSDVVVDVGVEREACPMGLAPTTSTTAALAMGDALAVVLINRRHFNQDDFKKFHPGGSLGERLRLELKEVMITYDRTPMVSPDSKVQQAIEEITAKGIGVTLVIEGGERKIRGIITDGDIRRAILSYGNILHLGVREIMSPSPMTIDENQTAAEALKLMEFHEITHLVVVDVKGQVKGVAHLHDLLGKKEFSLNGGVHHTTGADR
ncbi:MAG: KpsF/GutQ family sugar-phosphate isomerase [Desulfatiglans sp.]|jgi:arabinose-5-phosphate isomerase|nr:KpsF/GutQ family sugar-phosphate isomerase [Thermodesulfobacteriota bacterium]MEE4354048.1 KpsF/GutQ family sugar-phosphate isomerase [Desulfatiglans sp.]